MRCWGGLLDDGPYSCDSRTVQSWGRLRLSLHCRKPTTTSRCENDEVWVVECTDVPGDMTAPHEHRDSVMYTLTSCRRRLHAADERDVAIEAGTTRWLPVQRHAGENSGDSPTQVIFVGLKTGPAAAAPTRWGSTHTGADGRGRLHQRADRDGRRRHGQPRFVSLRRAAARRKPRGRGPGSRGSGVG